MVYLDTFLHGDEVAALFVMLMSHSALLYSTNKKTRHQHHYTTWRVSHTRKIFNFGCLDGVPIYLLCLPKAQCDRYQKITAIHVRKLYFSYNIPASNCCCIWVNI